MSRGLESARNKRIMREGAARARISLKMGGAFVAFVEAGEELDLIADFTVRWQIGRFDGAAAQPSGGLAFRGEVLGLDALIHEPGCFQGDCLTEFVVHSFRAPIL